jgi:Dual-action HEIGH metallo-peptidase
MIKLSIPHSNTTIGFLALCAGLALGCSQSGDDDTAEIIENLEKAGFPASEIAVFEGKVYVGNDAEVSLAASREMLESTGSTQEQYRTNNLVGPGVTKICVNGSTYTGAFSTALDLAIENYNQQGLRFTLARTPASGCSATITAQIQPGAAGGVAGFPSGGLPFPTITIFDQLSTYSTDVIEHVITHELGHTIGFRHTDYFNRAISCGAGGNEGDAGVGANHIIGTPTGATLGGSLMNACFRSTETGEFAAGDITGLKQLYSNSPPFPNPNPPTSCGTMVAGQSLGLGDTLHSCDGRFRLIQQYDGNLVLYKNGTQVLWSNNKSGSRVHFTAMQTDGNFVTYNTSWQAIFSSNTNAYPGATINMQNDGNLVIYHNGIARWSTNTGGN